VGPSSGTSLGTSTEERRTCLLGYIFSDKLIFSLRDFVLAIVKHLRFHQKILPELPVVLCCVVTVGAGESYFRAMHFSANRGIGIALCRLSVCLSVCLQRWRIVIT